MVVVLLAVDGRSRCLECTTVTMTATSARIEIFPSARRRMPVDGPPMNDFHYARRMSYSATSRVVKIAIRSQRNGRAAPDLPQHTLRSNRAD